MLTISAKCGIQLYHLLHFITSLKCCLLVLLYDTEEQGNGTLRLLQEAMIISMPAVTQWIHIQRLSPEKNGVFPCTPF
jgi:hypothetical protein